MSFVGHLTKARAILSIDGVLFARVLQAKSGDILVASMADWETPHSVKSFGNDIETTEIPRSRWELQERHGSEASLWDQKNPLVKRQSGGVRGPLLPQNFVTHG